MKLSTDQVEAVDKFDNWMREGSPHGVMKLTGMAGTGKTSVAIRLIDTVGRENAILAAPTGKAARRLAQKTGMVTMSVHQLTRWPTKEEDGKPIFSEKIWRGGSRPKLLVVDEASMCGFELSKSLLTFNTDDDDPPVPVLAIGDTGQLPPIGEKQCLLDLRRAGPLYNLTQIHRQAGDSGVLDLAYAARLGKEPRLQGNADDARVADNTIESYIMKGKGAKMVQSGVKFLVRYKKTAHMINTQVRQQLEFKEHGFQIGDTVMALNNVWDLNVQNGAEYLVIDKQPNQRKDRFTCVMKALDDGNTVYLPDVIFEDPMSEVKPRHEPGLVRVTPSYAITVHKSQGSEWDKVFIVNETHWKDTDEDKRKWLYTAITRAAKQVFVLGSLI